MDDILYYILVAISLCMDTFALSLTTGLILRKVHWPTAAKLACAFALPQALMLVLGWFGGNVVKDLITEIDHWLALIILSGVGGKMIYEGVTETEEKEDTEKAKIKPDNLWIMLGIGFATSFDALAIGVTYSLMQIGILLPALILLITTYIISFIGVDLGGRFKKIPDEKIAILGGLILIGLGIKILVEDLFF